MVSRVFHSTHHQRTVQHVQKQAQRRAAADRPGTKDTVEYSTRARILSHNVQNRFLLFPLF